MGNQKKSCAGFAGKLAKQRDDSLAECIVQVACGLISEDQAGSMGEGTAERNALLLASGENLYRAVEQVAQFKALNQRRQPVIGIG